MNNYNKIRQEQKEESRIKILEAAAICFANKGYTKTSIKDISEKAEVSHGLIGKYYKTKENLLSETYIYVTKNTYPIPDECLNLRERTEVLIKQSIDVMNKKPEYFNFFLRMIRSSDLPESYLKARLELFENAPIYESIENWKKVRNLSNISSYECFIQLLHTVYTILNLYQNFSLLDGNNDINSYVLLSYLVDAIEKDINNKKTMAIN